MAVCNTPQFGSATCPQLQLEVNVTSQTGGQATLTWILRYVAHGHAFYTSYAKSYSASVDGTVVKSGTYDINGKTSTYEIARGTKAVSKGSSARNIAFSCSMAFNATWGSTYGGSKSASGSIQISGKTTYTITYNANGGTGAPGNQVRTWGQSDFKLSTKTPTREGYKFAGWATSASGAVAYQPGAAYGGDANLTLYAKWTANTYTVSYNANGGSGAPTSQTKTYGVNLTLSSTKPTRTNYTFQGWGTSASSTTVAYNPGSAYTTNSSITLYAIWKLAYKAPRISSFTVDRCTSGGTVSETGTYALVKFSWATDRTVSSIKIEHKKDTATAWTATTVTGSSTSGSVSKVIGGGGLSTEYTYNIRVTVADSGGSSAPVKNIAPIAYDIDFLKGGGGIAIGQPASRKGFDVNMNTTIKKELEVVGGANVNGMLTVEGQFRPLGNLNGQLKKNHSGSSWIKARESALVRNTGSSAGTYCVLGSMKTPKGSWNIGTLGENMYFSYDLDTDYNGGTNATKRYTYTPDGLAVEDWSSSGTYNGSTVSIKLKKSGKVVHCQMYWVGSAAINTPLNFSSLKIPAEWRPPFDVKFMCPPISAGKIYNYTVTYYMIGTDGAVLCITNEPNYVERIASISWVTP